MGDTNTFPHWFMDDLLKKAEEVEEKPLPRAAQAFLDSLEVDHNETT